MRRALSTAAATLTLVLCSAGAAQAAPPVGGCPPGFGLFPASYVSPHVDAGNLSNRNGDAYSCFRQNRGLTRQAPTHVNAFTVIDNVVPLPR